jgi:hypothetical protein
VELRVESVPEKTEQFWNAGEDEGIKKIANPLRRAEPVRVACLAFIISFAASPGSVKGTSNLFSVTGDLAGFAPA